jgi:hypothetical protein
MCPPKFHVLEASYPKSFINGMGGLFEKWLDSYEWVNPFVIIGLMDYRESGIVTEALEACFVSPCYDTARSLH